MLELELRHYETVVAIVELGTMTAAARELHTTQSALSHRLAECERRLGTQLFDRGRKRRLTPTRAGLAVHQTASRAIAELERTERLLRSERSEVVSVVRIGVGSYDCFHWYPEFFHTARRLHPDVELDLAPVSDSPGGALADGDVDVVIAPGEPRGPLELRPLLTDELVLVTSPDHPLAELEVVEAHDLADEVYFTYNTSPTPGFEYDRLFRAAETYPRVVRVVPQTSAIAELVAAGAGVGILSRWALSPLIDAGRLHAIRCRPGGLPLEWNAVTRANEPAESPAARVRDLLARRLGPLPR
ncbi:LysR family transcriptional regulator [Ilumatobacter sp.]|uniref:LysR family transcriptional regulator n=1 Tax=Ilumatobacter sp. TaxID=1967498 RepID=UPI003B520544